MNLRPILIGCLSALVVSLIQWVALDDGLVVLREVLYSPWMILVVAAVGLGVNAWFRQQLSEEEKEPESELRRLPFPTESAAPKTYSGLANLIVHIHQPPKSKKYERWGLRGITSFVLGLFGGYAGPEGAAIEMGHEYEVSARSYSSRWFETQRRTGVACCLAAGLSSVFGAPFAAVLLPMEMGVGGRALSVVLSSFAAFLTMSVVETVVLGSASPTLLPLYAGLDGSLFYYWQTWATLVVVALCAGLVSLAFVKLSKLSRGSIQDMLTDRAWTSPAVGGVLILLVALTYGGAMEPGWMAVTEALRGELSALELSLQLVSRLLILVLVVSTFGTSGVFLPLFVLGVLASVDVAGALRPLTGGLPMGTGDSDLLALAGLVGAAALWGGTLSIPLTASVMAFEMSNQNLVIIPCYMAAVLASRMGGWFKSQNFIKEDLKIHGLGLESGRSVSVLESLTVRDAMVTDHEAVTEQENLGDLYACLIKSQYPFLPVTTKGGRFKGLLTADMVEDAWRAQDNKGSAQRSLSKLLEAKDLLYRSGLKVPTVQVEDPLTVTAGVFEQTPVVPVLDAEHRVAGLLFSYNVRIAYDREVGRRLLFLRRDQES